MNGDNVRGTGWKNAMCYAITCITACSICSLIHFVKLVFHLMHYDFFNRITEVDELIFVRWFMDMVAEKSGVSSAQLEILPAL